MVYDYCVVGGGIVGLATAMKLLEIQPGARLVVLEKEAGLSTHQTGHNSGVIHAGIYYAPGSLKADLCRRGSKATKEFCWNHRIPFETCGKLLVATNELELQRMNNLIERAKLNQIEVERLDAAGLRQREPNIIGVGGLFVPETGIVDFKRVCEGMAGVVRKVGATIELGVTVTAISESDSAVKISAGGREWQATKLIVCAGLQSDRLARMAGLKTDHQIVPFRGEYYRLPSSKNDIVRHLIYPIPDPDLPFLGVHLTRMMDGSVTVGPNAVLGFAREGYPKFSFNLHDVAEYSTFPGFWEDHTPKYPAWAQRNEELDLQSRLSRGVSQVLPKPRNRRSSALRGWHPRPSSDEGRHPCARFFVPGNCPHAPRLQCTVTCRYLRHPDRRNDRGENRWPLTQALCLELGNRSGLAYCYWNWGLLAREQHDRKTEREKLAAALDQAERGKRSQWWEYLLPSEGRICMATVEKISIALPPDMVALVRDAVGSGEYASSSEVIRDALREWKYKRVLRQKAIDELRAAVQEGLNSGPGENLDIETIIQRAKASRHAGHMG